jgi:hypothetical protein
MYELGGVTMTQQANVIEDLITDLIYLRKGAGFVSSRVYEASTFMTVIGGKNQIFESIKIRFISAVRSLPDEQNVEALLAAYGLLTGYEGVSLKERREKYGEKVKRKYDTLVDREAAAIKELAIRLLSAFYSGAPLPAELPLPHGVYLIDYIYVKTIMQDRQFVMHEQTRKVIALADNAYGFEYHNNERTKIIPIEGLAIVTKYVRSGSVHIFRFPKPLQRGQTHQFSFQEIREIPKIEEFENGEDFAGQSFETPTLKYEQEVVFIGEKPKIIWGYDKLSRIVRPGEPADVNKLEIDEDGSVKKDFFQLYGGFHSGIAWRWK